jgi:steroid delta-isomerase-like uncharacterized protein
VTGYYYPYTVFHLENFLMPITREIAERFFEAFDTRDAAQIVAGVSSNFQMHVPGMPPMGVAQTEEFMADWYEAFPNFSHERQHLLVDDDLAVVRVIGRGTHLGEFNGIPATGKPVKIEGFNLVRVTDGQVTESWAQFDGLGLMQQIGAIMPSDDADDEMDEEEEVEEELEAEEVEE